MKKRILAMLLCSIVLSMCISPSFAAGTEEFIIEQDVQYLTVAAEEAEAEYIMKDMETGEFTYYNVERKGNVSEEDVRRVMPGYIPETTVEEEVATENPMEEDVGEEAEPATIIGTDGRTKITNTEVSPYSAILYIEMTWPDGTSSHGTGYMISDNVAVTAAHCVYSYDHGGWASSVKVWPGKNGFGLWNNPYGTAKASRISSNSLYVDGNEAYDYGAMILDSDIGDKTGWFGLGSSETDEDITGTDIIISGYPGDDRYYQYTMSGEITRCQGLTVYTEIDVVGGNSGSPIYTSDNVAFGICTSESSTENVGRRFFDTIYDWYISLIADY